MIAAIVSETKPLPRTRTESDLLELDQHTLKDLEVFESEVGGVSLFQFCNLTSTKGGENVLRRRMERPWANPARIRATQKSLAFIIAEREAFKKLPSDFVINSVDSYAHDALPVVINDNLIEFTFGAFALRVNHEIHYFSILRGVMMTCKLIHTLRRFVDQPELASAAGELAPHLEEMRTLLSQPRLSQIPEEIRGLTLWKNWKILRLDHFFRVHEAGTLSRLLGLVYEIDALRAMADTTSKHGFTFPHTQEGAPCIQAEGLVHPYLQNAVSNPVALDQERRGLFLTGPNMAGKTTYLRAFATALYLAHLGMGVPASRYRFVPVERFISSISLSDSLHSGVSYFRAEALRVKEIAQAVMEGYRVVAIMDEPFKGTNVKDTFEASLAILERFSSRDNFLFMFSSHQIELADKLSDLGCPIDRRYFAAIETEDRLRFDYRLRSGVSKQRIGMRVLCEEGVFEILDGQPQHQPAVIGRT